MYDRFPMQGGVDLTTPYLQRVGGTLLQGLNYEPDMDGGYRKMRGFERFDGRPAPSAAVVTVMEFSTALPTITLGATVTGATSGANAVIGLIESPYAVWTDVRTGTFIDGEPVVISGPVAVNAVLAAAYPNTLDVTAVDNEYTNIYMTVAAGSAVPSGISEGDTLVGQTSGTVAIVRYIVAVPARPVFYLEVTSSVKPAVGEVLRKVGGAGLTVSSSSLVEDLANNPNTGAGLGLYFSEWRRSLIAQVPGSGPVRGVWDHGDYQLAFRDSADGSQGVMYRSSADGWELVSLGRTLDFKDRLTSVNDLDIIPGDVIKGNTSGATATVAYVGYTDQDHTDGYISITNISGTFQAGEVLHSNTQDKDLATVSAAATLNILPPGGQYRFKNHNFSAKVSDYNVHGVNGVGRGFIFGVNGFSFVRTQPAAELDKPFLVTIHYDHLFYAFPGGSVQHSVVGNPLDWSGALGALEVGLGAEVMDFIEAPKALIMATAHDIQSLTGAGADDWAKNIITSHVGVARNTGAYQTQSMILGPSGLVSIDRVDAYGDFSDALLSDKVRSEIRKKYPLATVGIADKTKSQYRIHFSDGTNLLFAFKYGEGGGVLGIVPFEYGSKVVRTVANPMSRMFFTSDDGYVYEAEKGVNNDGESRPAYFRTSFSFQQEPDARKRYRRITISVRDTEFLQATVGFTYSKGKNTVPVSFLSAATYGQGGRWDLDQWNYVFWDGADVPEIHSDMDGVGTDVSVMVYSDSRIMPDHVIEDMSIEYTPRRKVR